MIHRKDESMYSSEIGFYLYPNRICALLRIRGYFFELESHKIESGKMQWNYSKSRREFIVYFAGTATMYLVAKNSEHFKVYENDLSEHRNPCLRVPIISKIRCVPI